MCIGVQTSFTLCLHSNTIERPCLPLARRILLKSTQLKHCSQFRIIREVKAGHCGCWAPAKKQHTAQKTNAPGNGSASTSNTKAPAKVEPHSSENAETFSHSQLELAFSFEERVTLLKNNEIEFVPGGIAGTWRWNLPLSKQSQCLKWTWEGLRIMWAFEELGRDNSQRKAAGAVKRPASPLYPSEPPRSTPKKAKTGHSSTRDLNQINTWTATPEIEAILNVKKDHTERSGDGVFKDLYGVLKPVLKPFMDLSELSKTVPDIPKQQAQIARPFAKLPDMEDAEMSDCEDQDGPSDINFPQLGTSKSLPKLAAATIAMNGFLGKLVGTAEVLNKEITRGWRAVPSISPSSAPTSITIEKQLWHKEATPSSIPVLTQLSPQQDMLESPIAASQATLYAQYLRRIELEIWFERLEVSNKRRPPISSSTPVGLSLRIINQRLPPLYFALRAKDRAAADRWESRRPYCEEIASILEGKRRERRQGNKGWRFGTRKLRAAPPSKFGAKKTRLRVVWEQVCIERIQESKYQNDLLKAIQHNEVEIVGFVTRHREEKAGIILGDFLDGKLVKPKSTSFSWLGEVR